jgi:hypothetical protein
VWHGLGFISLAVSTLNKADQIGYFALLPIVSLGFKVQIIQQSSSKFYLYYYFGDFFCNFDPGQAAIWYVYLCVYRPKKRCVNCVKDDMRIKGVSMEMMCDRREWKKKTCCADPFCRKKGTMMICV